MRDIVNRSLDSAEKLMIDEDVFLDIQNQVSLSAWIAITIITAEFTDEKTVMIPSSDRIYLMDRLVPPPDWTITVGRYIGGTWEGGRYSHRSLPMHLMRPIGPKNISNSDFYVSQVSTYVLKRLVVQSMSSMLRDIVAGFRQDFIPAPMRQIWPVTIPFRWRDLHGMDDAMVVAATESFANFMTNGVASLR